MSILNGIEKDVLIAGKSYRIKSYLGTSSVETFILTNDESHNLVTGCQVDLNTGLISNVMTSIPYRRKGFCEYLLRFVIGSYNASNLFVKPDNFPAIELYAKLGFRVSRAVTLPTGEKSYIMEYREER